MVDDFVNPPAKEDLDPQGLLTIHYAGRVTRLPVSKNIGKKVPLAGSDVSVEIAEYLPNARLQADGRFVNVGDKPRNPVVELRVYLPGVKEPLRQVAKASFASPGGMHIDKCPVKFWYHHPAVAAEPAVEFLATSDGKLYCRVGNGKYESRGEVHCGRHARRLGRFLGLDRQLRAPCPPRADLHARQGRPRRGTRSETFEAAAEVELTAGDTTRRLWLQRGDDENGMPVPIKTSEGTLAHFLRLRKPAAGLLLAVEEVHAGHEPRRDGRCVVRQHRTPARRRREHRQGPRNFHERAAGPRKVHVLPVGNPAQRHGNGAHRGLRPGPVAEVSRQHHDLCGHADHVRHAFPACRGPAFPFFPDNDQDQGATHATRYRGQPGLCLPRRFGLWGLIPGPAVRLDGLAIAARPGRRPAEAAGQPCLGNLAVVGQSGQLHRPGDEPVARRDGLLHGHAVRFADVGQDTPLSHRERGRG